MLRASLSFTISQSLLKLISILSVTSFNQLILCHPLHFLPSMFPSRVFSNESALRIIFQVPTSSTGPASFWQPRRHVFSNKNPLTSCETGFRIRLQSLRPQQILTAPPGSPRARSSICLEEQTERICGQWKERILGLRCPPGSDFVLCWWCGKEWCMSGRETEREGPGEGRGRASYLLMSCTANSETGSPAAYANLHLTNLSHRSSTGSRITLDKDGNSPLPRAGLWAVGSGGRALSAWTAEGLHLPSPLTLSTGARSV